jgi:hypothetical protein
MKHPSNARQKCVATALVISLAFVVLLSAILVAYFGTTTSHFQSANEYRDTITVQHLTDLAINTVMGQVADGTKTLKEGAQAGEPKSWLAWNSQPGLIRSYGADGDPYRFFKLYSSDQMVIDRFPGGYWSPEENLSREVPPNWAAHGSLFTDIN